MIFLFQFVSFWSGPKKKVEKNRGANEMCRFLLYLADIPICYVLSFPVVFDCLFCFLFYSVRRGREQCALLYPVVVQPAAAYHI